MAFWPNPAEDPFTGFLKPVFEVGANSPAISVENSVYGSLPVMPSHSLGKLLDEIGPLLIGKLSLSVRFAHAFKDVRLMLPFDIEQSLDRVLDWAMRHAVDL